MSEEVKMQEPIQTNADNQNQAVDAAPQESPQEANWRKFREERAKERKRLEEETRLRQQAEEEKARKQQEIEALKSALESVVNKPSDPISDISEEDRIQKRIDEAIAKRERDKEEQRRLEEQKRLPQTLATTFKDFDQVCSTENLDYFEFNYPEIANAFKHQPDSLEKWSNVYHAVKRFVPNTESTKEANKAKINADKPQSMSVAGATASSDRAPINLDEKRRQDNWQRMQRVMRGTK